MASSKISYQGLTVEVYSVDFTFNNSDMSVAIPKSNVNGGNNHIAQSKLLFCYTPGNFSTITSSSNQYTIVLKLPNAYTGTITAFVGCAY